MNEINKLSNEELYKLAKRRVFAKKAFTIHLCTYIVISILLIIISLYNNNNWFIYPVVGWLIAVVIHKVSLDSFLNSNNDVENEFRNLKKQNEDNN